MSNIKYSIVVPTFNNLESCLKPCIESLIQHTDANNSEIIIVANGCTDGTKDYLMTLDNHFKVIWCDKALGYTCATNAGIKHSVGDYVVLLNNDNVVFDRCWLSVLEQPFVFDPAVGITGPVKDKHAKTGVEFLLFFCAMIRRDVINKVGLLDEIFNPGYGEDIDYCAKIKEAGFKVVQVPSDDKRAADADNVGHVINFPLWHKGSQTVHKVEKWEEVVQRNEEILQKRYVKEKLEKRPKYSIIIPTYNHLDDCLKPCIDSLIKYTDLQDFEIIIVANGCTDGTREYVKSLPNNFKLIWEDVALGYPKAVNLGIKAVRGDYVIMLNNDVVLTQQPKNYWLMLLERPFVANPKVGITGAYKSVFALVDNNINSVFFKNQYIPFFCAMIKGSVVNEIGLLDEIFGLGYAEDVDYCIRIAEKGYEIVEVPYDIEYSLDDLSMEGCDKDIAKATHKIQFPLLHAKSQTFSGLNLTIDDNTSLLFAKYGKKKLASLKNLRLNFLKRILLGVVDDKTTHEFLATKNYPSINKMIEVLSQNLDLSYVNGTIWPDAKAYTMIGLRRLDNLHYCLDRIRDGYIDGDVFEAGAWRGGACIFMAAYIKAYGMNKKVIVADSFDGLPLLDTEKYPQDHAVSPMLFSDYLKVSLDQVRKNFADFGLLDDNIIFVQGKFYDTLRFNNKINKLSLLRFDADTYEATATVLDNVYYKLSTNGFCIIDDYFLSDLVKQSTDNFREINWIEKEIIPIDNFGAFWQKEDPKFSIIIPTYNHVEDCLKPCVDSVLQNTNLANVEVIVVANGCVDGTKDYLQSLQNEVKQIWFEHALGYPKATNAGIDASKGQYIILLNNDVAILNFYPLNGWINCLYKACLQDKVGLAGPQKLFCDMLEFVFLCFFCVMIRREVFDKIGKIDEEFNNGYCDDNDFCYRALKAGYKYVQVPEDKDVHDESTNFPIYHQKAITFTNNKICAMHNCANQKQLLLKYANDASYISNKYKVMHAYTLACVKYYHDVDVIFENKKIYDCFLFYNELDLLEIRLNELADTVNYFVIVEATKTFTNTEKKLYFDDNKDRFSKFNHKIIHIIVDDMPNYGEGYDANWKREIYQRDCIKRGLTNCRGDDIVIISDVDEIPNKKSIKNYNRKFGICNLQMKLYYFFVNYRTVNLNWNNPKIMTFADMNENTCNEIRCLHQTHNLYNLSDGGWHYSYLGDYFNVVNKLASISHQEYNSDKFLNQERLLHKIANRQDIYDRGYVYDIDEIDASHPIFVQENKQNLTDKNLICPQNLNLEYLQKTFIQKKRKIYDCFIFYNELDLLYFRMQELKDHVDYFVVCEATLTHSGVEKPLYFDDNKNRFAEFADKIIHVVVRDLPNARELKNNGYGEGYQNNWIREGYHRECIINGLKNCQNDDIIILTDLDEIPNVEAIKNYNPNDGICCIEQQVFYYYMNYKCKQIETWLHPKIGIFGEMKKTSLTAVRAMHANRSDMKIIKNGGWHFSFLGGAEKIKQKLLAYCHQEFNKIEYTKIESIEAAVLAKEDILKRGYDFEEVFIDSSFPKYLQENLQHYRDLGFVNISETTENKQVENKIKYSIVIPTFNHLEDCLKPCIASIKNFTDLSDCEIIIVANGCVDGTKEYLQNLEKPFKVIWHDQPLGYAKPVNLGMREAVGEYVILMNNDTELIGQEKNAWINMLLQPFMRDEKIAATGPLVLHDGYSDCLFVLSFCMMIKRSVLSEVGYMDETYGFGGGEDVDFCARLQSHGYKLAEVPNKPQFNGAINHGGFPVYHKSNASRSDVAAIVDANKENNKNTSRNVIRHNKNIKVAIENKEPQDKTGYWSVGYDESCHLHFNPNLEGFLDDSVVEIYAGDYVDKLANNEIIDIFARWNEKLKADGKIRITSQKLGNITITKESTNNVQ